MRIDFFFYQLYYTSSVILLVHLSEIVIYVYTYVVDFVPYIKEINHLKIK